VAAALRLLQVVAKKWVAIAIPLLDCQQAERIGENQQRTIGIVSKKHYN
jgi:hypothetical protein